METVITRPGPLKFSGKMNRHNFQGQNLVRADFRGVSLAEANFTDADCSQANFEGANCWGAIFTNANLHRANFKDAILANASMDARDLFGVTFTVSCDTVNGVRMGTGWWAWLIMAAMMKGPDEIAADKLLALIGRERFLRYREHFQNRVL